jgi:hypothetical protein
MPYNTRPPASSEPISIAYGSTAVELDYQIIYFSIDLVLLSRQFPMIYPIQRNYKKLRSSSLFSSNFLAVFLIHAECPR